ncbi:hypothetical protein CJF42_25875, partial [Pseudoalteromonas sp. NBT06-2]|uniref:hypothetical protein n=1 Tax=Pseudoalteromonas sp. NBT06-2 TaxID=2025950 RepID=UPI000BCF152E
IEPQIIINGEIQATPDGVVYRRDNVMVFYDYQQEQFRYDDTFKNPRHLTAADAHHIYFVDNNIIKKYSTIGLEAGQYKFGINDEIFNDIYIDKEDKIWMLGMTNFHILDTNIKFEPFNFNSKYNVFGLVNNTYWIGTRIGVYQYENGKTSTIPWLDEIMPIEDYTVQNIVQFNDHAIISTSKGAYAVNLTSKTLTTRLSVDYIISANVIDGLLYIGNDRYGVQIFDAQFNQIDVTEINATLPSREILQVRKINKRLHIATAKGLWMQVDKGGELALEGTVISDVAMVKDRLFAASYGEGLFEFKQGKWESLPSPLYIKELIAGDKLYLTTSNGVHFLNDKNYTQLMARTGKHSFAPGGVIYSGDKIYMVSHLGFVIISKTKTPPIKELKLSYIKTDQHTYLNDNHIEIAQANW